MNSSSKRLLGIAAVSVLLLGAGTSGVFAYGGFGPGWGGQPGMMGGPGMMRGPGRMGGGPIAYQAQNLDQFKTTLGITPAQEKAWNSYAEAVKAKADLMTSHREAMFTGTVSPEQQLSFRQEGLTQMQKVLEARQGLNAVLTPEQQAKAGTLVGRRCRRW